MSPYAESICFFLSPTLYHCTLIHSMDVLNQMKVLGHHSSNNLHVNGSNILK